MAKKRKQRKQRASSPRSKPKSVPKRMAVGFEAALQLVKRKRWPEALAEFQKLNQQFPNRPEVLTELVNICYELQDMHLWTTALSIPTGWTKSGRSRCALFPPFDVYTFNQKPQCKSQFSRNRQHHNNRREQVVILGRKNMSITLG